MAAVVQAALVRVTTKALGLALQALPVVLAAPMQVQAAVEELVAMAAASVPQVAVALQETLVQTATTATVLRVLVVPAAVQPVITSAVFQI